MRRRTFSIDSRRDLLMKARTPRSNVWPSEVRSSGFHLRWCGSSQFEHDAIWSDDMIGLSLSAWLAVWPIVSWWRMAARLSTLMVNLEQSSRHGSKFYRVLLFETRRNWQQNTFQCSQRSSCIVEHSLSINWDVLLSSFVLANKSSLRSQRKFDNSRNVLYEKNIWGRFEFWMRSTLCWLCNLYRLHHETQSRSEFCAWAKGKQGSHEQFSGSRTRRVRCLRGRNSSSRKLID